MQNAAQRVTPEAAQDVSKDVTREVKQSAAQKDDGSHKQALVVLALAGVLLLVANGRNTLAVAAWLAPLFLLRFVRSQPAVRGLLIAWFALSATWSFQFRGMAPLPGVFYFILAGVYGLVGSLPFVLDRVLAPRVGGLRATLVFPFSWVAVDYLVAEFTPYGSWGNVAYTQHEALTLLQLTSITGLYGIGFLVAWFASIGCWAWEQRFAWSHVRRGVLALAAVVVAVLAFGGARLALAPPDGDTVRIAGITRPDIDLFPSSDVALRAMTGGLISDEELEQIRTRARSINDDLLSRTRRESRAGAKIVVWGEGNAFVFKQDEPELIRLASELARTEQVHLGLGVAAWNTGSPKPLENKLLFIGPDGGVDFEFWKAVPVPGGEAAISARDDGRIKTVTTPHGEIGGAICFDMDFPWLLRQAGDLNVDIMLAPSNDWREIDPWHSHMARLRAVEQGFNLVRHTSLGLSLATDYHGRVLTSMDHYTTATDRVMVAQVPTKGVRTIYSRVGDTFAWLCIGGIFALPLSRRARFGRGYADD